MSINTNITRDNIKLAYQEMARDRRIGVIRVKNHHKGLYELLPIELIVTFMYMFAYFVYIKIISTIHYYISK